MTGRIGPAALAFLVASLGIAVFSAMDAVMKGLAIAIGTYNALFWRSVAGLPITAIPWTLQGPRRPPAAAVRVHIERGVVGTVMAVLFFWGLARVPMAQAIALTFIAPIIALFLAALILKERIGPRAVTGTALGIAGVVTILSGHARANFGPDAFEGAIAILGSACAYAYNIILMRRQALLAPPGEIAVFQNATVCACLALAAPFLAEAPPASAWPQLILAAGLATVSMLLLSWAYARAEAHYLAPVEYTAFVWAALFGWWVFDESVGLATVAGAGLIILGCFIAARARPAPVADIEAAI